MGMGVLEEQKKSVINESAQKVDIHKNTMELNDQEKAIADKSGNTIGRSK